MNAEIQLERQLMLNQVWKVLRGTFGKHELDVQDIGMSQYGVSLRQAPFELAIVVVISLSF